MWFQKEFRPNVKKNSISTEFLSIFALRQCLDIYPFNFANTHMNTNEIRSEVSSLFYLYLHNM